MASFLFALTHSARPMNFARASLHALNRRYASPDRLKNPPPLHGLTREAVPHYTGNITLWLWDTEKDEAPGLLEFIRKPYKAQQAIVTGDELVVCGTSHLEVFPLFGAKDRPVRTITHPWFSGGHTVQTDPDGNYIVSCSAPDALLVFSPQGELRAIRRVPEALYGRNYSLRVEDDLRNHYIPNDLQLTHLNSGSPTPRGLLCSMLIPGAIGLFDPAGGFREITRGFVGCHAARWNPTDDSLYFADSCTGNIVELDWDGQIRRRHQLDSVWLQDVALFSPNHYLAGLSDRNQFILHDATEGRARWAIDCTEFGATTQFCSWARLDRPPLVPTVTTGRHTATIRSQIGGRPPHAQQKFATDSIAELSSSGPAVLADIVDWAQRAPGANLLSAAQWLQLAALGRHFQPDLIVELGWNSGRTTAALTSIGLLLERPVQVVTTLSDEAWALVAREVAPPVLAQAATQLHRLPDLPALRQHLAPLLAPARRVLILCTDMDHGNLACLIEWLLPLLAGKQNLAAFLAISDARCNLPLAYTDGGHSYLVLGDAISSSPQLPALIDFVSRNQLTLFSVDTALAHLRESEPARYNALQGRFGPTFADQGHWRWLTLNENREPFIFPQPQKSPPSVGTGAAGSS